MSIKPTSPSKTQQIANKPAPSAPANKPAAPKTSAPPQKPQSAVQHRQKMADLHNKAAQNLAKGANLTDGVGSEALQAAKFGNKRKVAPPAQQQLVGQKSALQASIEETTDGDGNERLQKNKDGGRANDDEGAVETPKASEFERVEEAEDSPEETDEQPPAKKAGSEKALGLLERIKAKKAEVQTNTTSEVGGLEGAEGVPQKRTAPGPAPKATRTGGVHSQASVDAHERAAEISDIFSKGTFKPRASTTRDLRHMEVQAFQIAHRAIPVA